MSYTIDKLPDRPVVLQTFQSGLSPEELVASVAELTTILDAQSEPVYCILDMTQVSLGLDDVIAGANMAARGSKPPFRHPNVREVVFVSSSGLVKLGARGLTSATFGNIAVRVFDTVHEALAYTSQ